MEDKEMTVNCGKHGISPAMGKSCKSCFWENMCDYGTD